jgi:hypothetical protein
MFASAEAPVATLLGRYYYDEYNPGIIITYSIIYCD